MGQGLLVIQASRSNSDTPQPLGIFWWVTSPIQGYVTDNQRHWQETNIHAHGAIRTSNPRKQEAVDCAATRIYLYYCAVSIDSG
jgi:hypothetical protein